MHDEPIAIRLDLQAGGFGFVQQCGCVHAMLSAIGYEAARASGFRAF